MLKYFDTLRAFLNKSNNSNESNKSYTLRGALVCDRANTLTAHTGAAARGVAAATEVQATSVVGDRRTERTRPVEAGLTHAARTSTDAQASSREEDTVAVGFTGYKITIVSTLGCPGTRAFILITEFFKLSLSRHAPRTAPVLTGGVVSAGRADARLTANLVSAPTVARAVKAVKAVAPVVA